MRKRAGARSLCVVRLHTGLLTSAMAMSADASRTPATVPHSASQSPMRRHPPNAMAIGPRRIQAVTNTRVKARREEVIAVEYNARAHSAPSLMGVDLRTTMFRGQRDDGLYAPAAFVWRWNCCAPRNRVKSALASRNRRCVLSPRPPPGVAP